MSKLTQQQIDKAVKDAMAALATDESKSFALVYPDGFVPNSYKWRALAQRVRVKKDGSFAIEEYDRKRPFGRGSYITLWK